MKTVIVPDRNQKDLNEIPKALRRKLNWVCAQNMADVLNVALVDKKTAAQSAKQADAKTNQISKSRLSKARRKPLRKGRRERSIPLRP
jgi:ATP-dependent Lon protease